MSTVSAWSRYHFLPNPYKASPGNFPENVQHRQLEFLFLFQYPQRFKDFKNLLTSSSCESGTERFPFFLQMGSVIRPMFDECFGKGVE